MHKDNLLNYFFIFYATPENCKFLAELYERTLETVIKRTIKRIKRPKFNRKSSKEVIKEPFHGGLFKVNELCL